MGSTLLEVLKTTRPHQWVKNVFVGVPVVFSEHLDDLEQIGRAAAAFGLFCMFSGCVYILNDLLDVEADRVHPTKKDRPIASGRLPVTAAKSALGLLLLLACAGAVALSGAFAAIAVGYFVFNIAYSKTLKHIAYVDVLAIAAGFILRIQGGAMAIEVPLSAWLILCTFLLSVYLALGKRMHELAAVGAGRKKQRPVLERYRADAVQRTMLLCGLATCLAYTAYTLVGDTVSTFSPRHLVWTIPSVAFGVFRFERLVRAGDGGTSPTDRMLRDLPFLANLALYAAVVVVIIYLRPI